MKRDFFFKTVSSFFLVVMVLGGCQMVYAQTSVPSLPDTSKMAYNQMSSGLKLYVFPAKGQSKSQQKADEFECYKWAMEQSGIDPLNLPKVAAPAPKTGPTGGAVVGGAKGAAAGVAIGAIAGDAGKGAAIGAVAGGLAGRRQAKNAQHQQNQQAQASAAKSEQDMKDSFVKGFSACLEGKGYTIK